MDNFDNVTYCFEGELLNALHSLPPSLRSRINEVRIGVGRPVSLLIGSEIRYLTRFGYTSGSDQPGIVTTKKDVEHIFMNACEYSIHKFESSVLAGFIPLKNGCRAGISGKSIGIGSKRIVTDVTSINIRIARDFPHCADDIVCFAGDPPSSLVICGAPATGKTTLLRDLARTYSENGLKVSVIDERFELGAFPLGPLTDIISGCAKASGIESALRTMSPQLIVFDEIGSASEGRAINSAFSCGVPVITSIHSGNTDDAVRRLREFGVDTSVGMTVISLETGSYGKICDVVKTDTRKLATA